MLQPAKNDISMFIYSRFLWLIMFADGCNNIVLLWCGAGVDWQDCWLNVPQLLIHNWSEQGASLSTHIWSLYHTVPVTSELISTLWSGELRGSTAKKHYKGGWQWYVVMIERIQEMFNKDDWSWEICHIWFNNQRISSLRCTIHLSFSHCTLYSWINLRCKHWRILFFFQCFGRLEQREDICNQDNVDVFHQSPKQRKLCPIIWGWSTISCWVWFFLLQRIE